MCTVKVSYGPFFVAENGCILCICMHKACISRGPPARHLHTQALKKNQKKRMRVYSVYSYLCGQHGAFVALTREGSKTKWNEEEDAEHQGF